MIHALIFDFDGLILDTETPEFHVWQRIFRQHAQELDATTWGQVVGGYGLSEFDPASHLQSLVNHPLDLGALRARHRRESDALTERQSIMPGVLDYLAAARRLDLRLAIASSSPHDWVDARLQRLGLLDYFEVTICSEDVGGKAHTKPHPDLYLKTLAVMHLSAGQALAFEDSPNGVQAARAAGIFVVAVPNPLTALLGVGGADLVLPSLAAMPLADVLARADHHDPAG